MIEPAYDAPEDRHVQTFIAFSFDTPVPVDRIRAGLQRVERWYEPLWGVTPRSRCTVDGGRGLQLWDDASDQRRWPGWSEARGQTVVSLHVPLGFEALTGSVDRSEAPVALVGHLRAHPEDVQRLTPPFVLASAGADRLTLMTDGLGLGRLHEVQTAEGRFWSNRPVAALLFAGLRAEPDQAAWLRMAACDWAMGDATPYAGVRVVPAGTRIEVDAHGCRTHTLDVLADLVARRRDPLDEASLATTEEALRGVARSIASVWPGVPVLSLSGGRDSRLVAAAFLAAGIEVRLKTYGAVGGEADTARRLVALLPGPVAHDLTTPAAQQSRPRVEGAWVRARRWHDATEGLRPALYLSANAPRTLPRHDPPLICGVGGEFAHAPGYPVDVEQLEKLAAHRRRDAMARSLQAKIVLPSGPSDEAVASVATQIRRVLDHAIDHGVADAKSLDWFYADERLRRFGMTGESSGRLMPLLVPAFLSASFGLSTTQSSASDLHTALIARLVPAWAGVPFYTATLRQRKAQPQRPLWEESDVDVLAAVLADPSRWGGGFDVPRVQAIWQRARAGRPAARDELLLQRVVWRAAFDEHLAAVNGDLPPAGRARPAAAPASGPGRVSRRFRGFGGGGWLGWAGAALRHAAGYANDIPLARRFARTGLGRRLRRRLGV